MTEDKRFKYDNYAIVDTVFDQLVSIDYDENVVEIIVEWLNELHRENKQLKDKRWEIMKLIIEYDTTNNCSEKDVINKIKNIMGLVMIE